LENTGFRGFDNNPSLRHTFFYWSDPPPPSFSYINFNENAFSSQWFDSRKNFEDSYLKTLWKSLTFNVKTCATSKITDNKIYTLLHLQCSAPKSVMDLTYHSTKLLDKKLGLFFLKGTLFNRSTSPISRMWEMALSPPKNVFIISEFN